MSRSPPGAMSSGINICTHDTTVRAKSANEIKSRSRRSTRSRGLPVTPRNYHAVQRTRTLTSA
jgi:hypothetical protein